MCYNWRLGLTLFPSFSLFLVLAGASWTWTADLQMMRLVLYHYATTARLVLPFFIIFNLPVTKVATGLEPLTFGWWGMWSTTVLPQLKWFRYFSPFSLSPGPTSVHWTWTLDLWMMRHVVYRCATTEGLVLTLFQSFSLFLVLAGASWTWTADLQMMRLVLYHYATTAGLVWSFFHHFQSPSDKGGNWTWTLDIWMVRHVVYQRATSAGQFLTPTFSLFLVLAGVDGLELTIGL